MEEEKNPKKEIEELRKRVEELEKKLKETEQLKDQYLEGWQRARAELLNYKKEEMERIGGLIELAKESLIFEFLPILDSFDLAEKSIKEEVKNQQEVKGFLQIKKQILEFLKKHGVEEIASVGQKFDPSLHEVVAEIDTDEFETGTILEEVQKGYKINNRVLRVAKVKVAK